METILHASEEYVGFQGETELITSQEESGLSPAPPLTVLRP